jgi:hypothetical protein
MDKLTVLAHLLSGLEIAISDAESARQDAQTEANYHVGAMQSRYDSFKEEAQYLAAGQTKRIFELGRARHAILAIQAVQTRNTRLERVIPGCLTRLRWLDDENEVWIMILPWGAGQSFALPRGQVNVIGQETGLARLLLQQSVGSVLESEAPPLIGRSLEILEIC